MIRNLKCILAAIVWVLAVWAVAGGLSAAQAQMKPTRQMIEEILDQIEKRYAGPGFAAGFYQESTLKEMDITDSASGNVFVKRPGKMRWEYQKPDVQIIITDSERLWIYRPDDNQVMVGEAPVYFGGGKGASFLSDMKSIRKSFKIRDQIVDTDQAYVLKLVPLQKMVDIMDIYLTVSKKTFEIEKIVTFNSFGDRTRIHLSHFDFSRVLDDDMFRFTIPKGVDVLKLEP